jgi:hypothetical protein
MDNAAPKRERRHHHERMNSGRAAGDLRKKLLAAHHTENNRKAHHRKTFGSCNADFALNKQGTLCSGESVVPTFFLIGAQKCGTTSLSAQMAETFPNFVFATKKLSKKWQIHQAKQVFGVKTIGERLPLKEVHFFDSRVRSCSYYLNEFQHARECSNSSNSLAVGIDATPAYFPLRTIPLKLRKFLGRSWGQNARFAIILRAPEDRMLSFYNHFCNNHGKCKSATVHEWALKGVALHRQGGVKCAQIPDILQAAHVICGSMYAKNLKPWLSAFSPSQFLIIPFSKYVTDPRPALTAIGSHAGILTKHIEDKIAASEGTAQNMNEAKLHNRGGVKATMSPELKAELAAFFRPYNLGLQTLVQTKGVPVAYNDGPKARQTDGVLPSFSESLF